VIPYQDHISYLHEQLDLGSGTPAIAKGDVDVQVAESGVALAIRMGPMMARVSEKEQDITDVTSNMMYDLRKWAQAYEPTVRSVMEEIRWIPTYGEKIPINRKQRFQEIMQLVENKMVSRKWAKAELVKIGFDLPDSYDDMMNEILTEQAALAQIEEDVTGARLDRELSEIEETP
jgi:hypothetical protein